MARHEFSPLTAASCHELKKINFGHAEVDLFVQERAWHWKRELLIQTWTLSREGELCGFISFANSTIPAEDSDRQLDTHGITLYPAVQLSFIGVRPEMRGGGIGQRMIIQWMQSFAADNNKTGCRIVTVHADAHLAKPFYKNKLGFEFISKPAKASPLDGGAKSCKMFRSLLPFRPLGSN